MLEFRRNINKTNVQGRVGGEDVGVHRYSTSYLQRLKWYVGSVTLGMLGMIT